MKNSIVLITGGTGTFGKGFVRRCLDKGAKEIRVFSRDEKKQYEMNQEFKDFNNIKYYIGDIRDKKTLDIAMKNVDFVFHAAAMKQIPSCEQNPLEAIKTNILGSENVLNSAIENQVKKVVCLSTDKAVAPTSVMGLTKSLMEKTALKKAKEQATTEICITRFCNLIVSNGSVVPLFIKQINNNEEITVTDPNMTRYFMSLNEAIDLVEQAFYQGNNGDIFIKNAKLCKISDLAEAVKFVLKKQNHPVKIIGARAGEKRHEDLLTKEELNYAYILKDCIIIPMDKKHITKLVLLKQKCLMKDIVSLIKEDYYE